ncbi:hypothetical protein BGLA2_530008 [Burkholderia gladioli]|nr:hypothetical protein BGLA2_530008 [Burkholderia gladioli]
MLRRINSNASASLTHLGLAPEM